MSKKTQFLILLFFGISFHSYAQDFISISNSENSKVFLLIKENLTEEIIGKTAICYPAIQFGDDQNQQTADAQWQNRVCARANYRTRQNQCDHGRLVAATND